MSAVFPDMLISQRQKPRRQAATASRNKRHQRPVAVADVDIVLLSVVISLLCLGLVMVASASITIADRQYGEPMYFLYRQMTHVAIGIVLIFITSRIYLEVWERISPWLFILGVMLLILVLVPGIGREVNGSLRWLSIAGFNIQPSEFMKLAVVFYVAGYLVRRGEEVRNSAIGFLKPMVLMLVVAGLLLMEPDFGAAAIIFATVLGMMFLGGVRLWQYALLVLVVAVLLSGLALSSPYRLERITSFINPWADPFNRGFQLTQALIAFGRGEWFGVGLGGSIQKLFYLPEAHTDFLFAVLAEELGMLGAFFVVGLYVFLVWRAFMIASQAETAGKIYNAFLAYGLGLWIALQVIVNLGVNMGLLPTKGLTLPLMSYGGSSILIMCCAVGLLMRVDRETRLSGAGGGV
jgi:cell division protein FtsW